MVIIVADQTRVKDVVIELLATVTERDVAEIAANLNASLTEDFHLSSLQYFPLLGGLEDRLNIELDYSGFLTDVHTVNEAIDYVAKIVYQASTES